MSQEQDDVVRIRVADFDVGVIGLKRTIEEISESSTATELTRKYRLFYWIV